jgi:hypothetical protein
MDLTVGSGRLDEDVQLERTSFAAVAGIEMRREVKWGD